MTHFLADSKGVPLDPEWCCLWCPMTAIALFFGLWLAANVFKHWNRRDNDQWP